MGEAHQKSILNNDEPADAAPYRGVEHSLKIANLVHLKRLATIPVPNRYVRTFAM